MNKARKSEILKHWFGIDSILFDNAKNKLNEENYEQYISTKGAFLSNLFEIYNKLGYKPQSKCKSIKCLVENGKTSAIESKTRANSLMENKTVLNSVRKELQEMGTTEKLGVQQVAKYVIQTRRNAIALDSMLLESILKEKGKGTLNNWKGKVLLDAHKTLRDSLIEISLR